MQANTSQAVIRSLVYLEMVFADHQRERTAESVQRRICFDADAHGTDALVPGSSFTPRGAFDPVAPCPLSRVHLDYEPLSSGTGHRVYRLVRNYRARDHNRAAVDPLDSTSPCLSTLRLEYCNFDKIEPNLAGRMAVISASW
jgi:2-oxoglutarate dehydrogenase complex dehydrogenase (E1) component-like enzyme